MEAPNEIPVRNHVSRRLRHLRDVSPVSFAYERFFYILQRFSPERIFVSSRIDIQNRFDDRQERKAASRQRGRIIELYIMLWFLIEASIVLIYPSASGVWWNTILIAVIGIRVLDIFQITVNTSIFDRVRLSWRDHYAESVPRALILAVWNYLELMLCFGILYTHFYHQGLLHGAGNLMDPYYFSAVTQMTIGYGDIKPLGAAKIVTMIQGFTGFLFQLLILGRMVALLPEIKGKERGE